MKISEYLTDNNGEPSSKRLISYQLAWFFMLFNAIIWPFIAYLSFGNPDSALDANWLIGLLSFDFIVLLSIFTPTQLSKIQEVKQLIELTKISGKEDKQ